TRDVAADVKLFQKRLVFHQVQRAEERLRTKAILVIPGIVLQLLPPAQLQDPETAQGSPGQDLQSVAAVRWLLCFVAPVPERVQATDGQLAQQTRRRQLSQDLGAGRSQ